MKYYHLTGPDGFYFRTFSKVTALRLRVQFAAMLGDWRGTSWAWIKLTPSNSPVSP